MEIIAHRGASYDAPENTLKAIRLAWEQHADAVEIDIHLTADNHIVVLHDYDTQRVTGQFKKVAQHTLAELRDLTIEESPPGTECIPTLDEVLVTVASGKRLVIEVKCGAEILPALQDALTRFASQSANSQPWQQILIIIFDYPTLYAVKQAMPQVEVAWLSAFREDATTGVLSPTPDYLIEQAKTAGFEGLDVHYRGAISGDLVRQAKAAGLRCYVWTVNDAEVARTLREVGIDGITTDRPDWLRQQLSA